MAPRNRGLIPRVCYLVCYLLYVIGTSVLLVFTPSTKSAGVFFFFFFIFRGGKKGGHLRPRTGLVQKAAEG